jgi:hypothetical protein
MYLARVEASLLPINATSSDCILKGDSLERDEKKGFERTWLFLFSVPKLAASTE